MTKQWKVQTFERFSMRVVRHHAVRANTEQHAVRVALARRLRLSDNARVLLEWRNDDHALLGDGSVGTFEVRLGGAIMPAWHGSFKVKEVEA